MKAKFQQWISGRIWNWNVREKLVDPRGQEVKGPKGKPVLRINFKDIQDEREAAVYKIYAMIFEEKMNKTVINNSKST